jgi:hypothetical protein
MTHNSHAAKTTTVKNLFDSSLARDTKQRIMELHHSQRLWGNMTVAQTLAHCTSGLEMAMGVINPKRAPFPANIVGLLIKPLTSPCAAIHLRRRSSFPRTTPSVTSSENAAISSQQSISSPMKAQVLLPAATSFFWSAQTAAVAILMYKHIDHHLRQFGV